MDIYQIEAAIKFKEDRVLELIIIHQELLEGNSIEKLERILSELN